MEHSIQQDVLRNKRSRTIGPSAMNSESSDGLRKYPFAPRASISSRSRLESEDVTTRTSASLQRELARSFLSMSSPLKRGILMSSRMRSGRGDALSASTCSKNRIAFSPSSATWICASTPDAFSARRIRATSDLLSSAIRICQDLPVFVLSDWQREVELRSASGF
jgi:hypothetical protein